MRAPWLLGLAFGWLALACAPAPSTLRDVSVLDGQFLMVQPDGSEVSAPRMIIHTSDERVLELDAIDYGSSSEGFTPQPYGGTCGDSCTCYYDKKTKQFICQTCECDI